MKLQIEKTDIVLRPSSIDEFFACPMKWALTHLVGKAGPNSFRAAIGTAIHKGAEHSWIEAQATGKESIDLNYDVIEPSLDKFREIKDNVIYQSGENLSVAEKEIIKGSKGFYEDIFPISEIPVKVEQKLSVPVKNPLIKEVAGTVDYLTLDTIADLKTSTRKVNPASHTMQQSIYKWLAKENNFPVETNLIQAVILNKNSARGEVLELEPKEELAKKAVQKILDVMEIVAKNIVPLDILFRGNPKHVFCGEKYCNYFYDCPYTESSSPFDI